MRAEGTIARRITVFAWVALFAACSENVGPPPPPASPTGLLVSNPQPAAALVTAGTLSGSRSPTSPAAADSIVYVSLTAGSVPSGTTAAVHRVGDEAGVITTVIDGGFDPVAISASVGDSIEVVVRDGEGGVVTQYHLAVAAVRRPVVVRTEPPPRKRDQPLNAAIVVVFSEPIDGASLTSASVQLLQGTTALGGTVRFLDPTLDASHVSVEFVPNAPLTGETDYQLVVTPDVRDADGEALAAADTVAFTTGQGSTGAPASIHTSPDSILLIHTGDTYRMTATVRDSGGNILTGYRVTWSGGVPGVYTISPTGLVNAVSDGFGLVTAGAGGVGHLVFVLVSANPAATLTIAPSTATLAVGDTVILVATVRDAAGRVISTPIVGWGSGAPEVATVKQFTPGDALAVVRGINPGNVTISASCDTAHATATVTVTQAPPVPAMTTFDSEGRAIVRRRPPGTQRRW